MLMISATVRPSRIISRISEVMSATASGWFSFRPRPRRFRASSPAEKIRSLSTSRGVRCTALELCLRGRREVNTACVDANVMAFAIHDVFVRSKSSRFDCGGASECTEFLGTPGVCREFRVRLGSGGVLAPNQDTGGGCRQMTVEKLAERIRAEFDEMPELV